MRGSRRLPAAAPHPGEDGGLRVCIDYPGLNRVASQERFWPSRVGHCEGPPHSYVRMPFGLPSMAVAFQPTCGASWRLRRPGTMPSWRRWRRSSGNLLNLQSLPRLRAPVAHEEPFLQRAASAAPTLLRLQNQVTSSKLV